eukprot:9106404-Lingulodinium_polyedra.AAC.1
MHYNCLGTDAGHANAKTASEPRGYPANAHMYLRPAHATALQGPQHATRPRYNALRAHALVLRASRYALLCSACCYLICSAVLYFAPLCS